MIENILAARVRETGEQKILMSGRVLFSDMKAELQKFDSEHHDEYDQIGIYRLEPQTRIRKFTVKSEVDAHNAATQKAIDDAAALEKKTPAEKAAFVASKRQAAAGGKRADRAHSPIIAEFVNAGYDPKNYPPAGCEAVSTKAEIDAAIAAYKK